MLTLSIKIFSKVIYTCIHKCRPALFSCRKNWKQKRKFFFFVKILLRGNVRKNIFVLRIQNEHILDTTEYPPFYILLCMYSTLYCTVNTANMGIFYQWILIYSWQCWVSWRAVSNLLRRCGVWVVTNESLGQTYGKKEKSYSYNQRVIRSDL